MIGANLVEFLSISLENLTMSLKSVHCCSSMIWQFWHTFVQRWKLQIFPKCVITYQFIIRVIIINITEFPRTLSNISAISLERVSNTCSPRSKGAVSEELELWCEEVVVPALTLENATNFMSISFSRLLACFRRTCGIFVRRRFRFLGN